MTHTRKKNILVVTGTRAEYGLLRSTILEIQKSKLLSVSLLVTGMHTLKKYGLTKKEIEKDGIAIAAEVKVGENDNMLTALSKEISGIQKYCEANRPDLIVVLGDRDEPFAAAIVAGHLKIPVAHIHGGDVTGPIIDEYIRHSITKFSHLHFPVSKKSYERILMLGEEKWRVLHVGAPGLDEIRSTVLKTKKELAQEFGLDVKKDWFLVVQHPVALFPLSVKTQIETTLKALDITVAEKIVIYPNSDTGSDEIITALEKRRQNPHYYIYKNIPRADYLSLLKYVTALVGNSSSGILEAGYFHTPVLDIGPRQADRECAKNVVRIPHDQKKIEQALKKVSQKTFRQSLKHLKHPYGNGTAAKKIVGQIEKYINHPDLFYKKCTYVS